MINYPIQVEGLNELEITPLRIMTPVVNFLSNEFNNYIFIFVSFLFLLVG
jgi:hypothetical protein